MIKKSALNQIDQLLEDTFPTGSIPPNGVPAGAGTTAEMPASQLIASPASAPAGLALVQPSVEYLKQLGALRHQVKETGDKVRLLLQTIQDDRTPRTSREKELLGDEVRALWRTAIALDDVLFNFVIGNRWNS